MRRIEVSEYYVLDGREVRPVASVQEWAKNFERDTRRIAKDQVGEVAISTVFLGINHAYGDGPPMLFETMVFGGPLDDEQVRYSTYDEAERGHAAMIDRVKAAAAC